MLQQWYSAKDSKEWVLGTIYQTTGSSYRKAGAMMMYSSSADQLGLLSGGCLESDILLKAKRVMQTKRSLLLCYDGTDEDDISYQLGIGCGGIVRIMLQVVSKDNHYLGLDKVHLALKNRQPIIYEQSIAQTMNAQFSVKVCDDNASHFRDTRSTLIESDKEQWLKNYFYSKPHILVCGGSYDARPLVESASKLGWEVTVWDPRPANARPEHFSAAHTLLRKRNTNLYQYAQDAKVNAIVLMSHNVGLDVYALEQLIHSQADYIGMLGPRHRKEEVAEAANLLDSPLLSRLQGPIGIEIGARLPESIALSILSEIHQRLFYSQATDTIHDYTSRLASDF